MLGRFRFQLIALAAASAALTAVLVELPRLWVGESVTTHTVVTTTISLTAVFTAIVVAGRVHAEPQAVWVGLLAGLVLLAGANLPFSVIPTAVGDPNYFGVWAPLLASVAGAAVIASSSAAGGAALRRDRRWAALAVTGALAVLVAVAALVDILRPALQGSVSLRQSVHGVDLFDDPAPLAVLRYVNVVLWTVAAVGFVRRAERTGDRFCAWVASGCVLEAAARVQALAVPSGYPRWFLLADVFKLGGYALLAAGAVGELSGYWSRLADAAVLEERRRIARDMHDGLAQELAFIAAESDGELALAAHRALDESRRAIAALTRPVDEPVATAIAQAAEDVAHRWGARVRVVVEESADVDADVREELVRIVREAVTNAARHSGSADVRVEVGGGEALRLRVVDGGRGFDPSAAQRGHGLVSMRERARTLGATLDIRSHLGKGTEVEVTLA